MFNLVLNSLTITVVDMTATTVSVAVNLCVCQNWEIERWEGSIVIFDLFYPKNER